MLKQKTLIYLELCQRIKQKLILVNADKYDENDMKQLGNFMKVYYNGLVKKPQNIPASSGQHSQGIF